MLIPKEQKRVRKHNLDQELTSETVMDTLEIYRRADLFNREIQVTAVIGLVLLSAVRKSQ